MLISLVHSLVLRNLHLVHTLHTGGTFRPKIRKVWQIGIIKEYTKFWPIEGFWVSTEEKVTFESQISSVHTWIHSQYIHR